MTTTDTSIEQDQRAAAIAGLHELADFLAEHPAVPMPFLGICATFNLPALVAWIDGLDDIDVRPGTISTYRSVVRRFAGLDVALDTRREHVGEVREVPGMVTELVQFTAEEIRERAVQS